jgi:hypothetical protein
VDEHTAPKVTSLWRGKQALQFRTRELACETSCDEDRLPVARDAQRRELAEHGREGKGSRIQLRSRHRERGWLDDDGHAAGPRDEVREGWSVEGEAQRVADRGYDVHHLGRRCRWSEDHVVVPERDLNDP